MGIVEDGSTRQAQAVKALQAGALAGVEKKFQARLYRLDSHLTRIADLKELQAAAPATHIGDSLKQFADETADLPIGAIVLLSDGADNSGTIDLDTISALRNRHIPVHTVGVGREQASHDVEIDDALVAPRTLADSRLGAVVRFHQRGYAGRKAKLTVRDGTTVLSSREVTLEADGNKQSETLLFNVGAAGAKALQYSVDGLPDEENVANNAVTRLVNVESDKRRVLYIEGEPRWEYKFIRRAEDDDRLVQLVPMLRTTENKIYRQNIQDPKELAEGFPTRPEDLFAYQALVIGSVEATYFTPAQRELIREFVDRRGGGLLLLGGRFSLADGGWGVSNLADLLPVVLPDAKNTFHVEPATVELAPAGRGQLHHPPGRRSGGERRALEEAAVPDGLPGTRRAQARRRGAGRHERPGPEDAAARHRELRARPHGRARHLRHLAMGDAPAVRRSDPRSSGSSCCAGSSPTRPATSSPRSRTRCCSTMGESRCRPRCAARTISPLSTPGWRRTSSVPAASRPTSR